MNTALVGAACRFATRALLIVLGAAAAVPAAAQTGMPDPRQMSGIPLPAGDLAAGTVTVRLIKGSLANPIAGHDVELQGAATEVRSKTNDAGRAEFIGLQPGTRVRAVAVVNGERLESQEFELPASSGIRLMLVATDAGASGSANAPPRRAPTPQTGSVVLGDQSRFVFELADDGMAVFNILEIRNDAGVPVDTPAPLVFELPAGAVSPGIVQGSSPQATLDGRRFVVEGPFAPGVTLVQFGYSMPYSGAALTVSQRLPIAMPRLTVLAQKAGDTRLASPQISQQREMNAEGQTYIVAQGPGIPAGQEITFEFAGLPHTAMWPRNVALGLALLILAAGAWGGMRRGPGPAAAMNRRRQLEARRDRLFGELTALEEQQRAGAMEEERYAAKRRQVVGALERIYAELDEEAAA